MTSPPNKNDFPGGFRKSMTSLREQVLRALKLIQIWLAETILPFLGKVHQAIITFLDDTETDLNRKIALRIAALRQKRAAGKSEAPRPKPTGENQKVPGGVKKPSFLNSVRRYNPFHLIKFRPLRYFIYFLLFTGLLFIAADSNFLWLFGSSPTLKEIKNPQFTVASEVFTADGKLIGRFYRENRTPVTYEELPENLINALVSTEDERFYKHHGIDLYSIVSSMWSTARGDKRGGSTITQQLAKNLFHTRRKKAAGGLSKIPGLNTLISKLKEWVTALKIEHVYSKKQILALYLNTVSFGNNTYGIKVAARKYFSKAPSELQVQESALLVGMLKATSTYNPVNNPEKALTRRNVVLSQLYRNKQLSHAAYIADEKLPLGLNIADELDDENKDSYLRSAVANQIKAWVKKSGYDIYSDGLKIYTTIDSRFQQYAEEAVDEKMKQLQSRLNSQWKGQNPWVDEDGNEIKDFVEQLIHRMPQYELLSKKYPRESDLKAWLNKKKRMTVFTWKGEQDTTFSTVDSLEYYARILQTGMMSFEPVTGEIKAWVGGISNDFFKYDHVMQSKRQAGSTFKPFVYLAAIDNGFSPCDRITDKPVTINYTDVVDGKKKSWSPKNADWHFTGYDMSLRWAMGKSCNSVTAQLTEKIGPEMVVKYAKMLGIHSDLKAVPSIGLGPFDVSLFDMVGAYGTFLNKGVYTEPMLIARIEDHDGNLIEKFSPKTKKVLSDETAWLMLYMLQGGVQEPGGTSQALWEYDLWKKGNEIGGKTGTSSNFSDAWYMGVTKDLVTGVWVGAENRSVHFKTSQTGEGSRTALPIFGRYLEKLYHDPKSGIIEGRFPKLKIKSGKKYYCPTPVPKRDTSGSASDSSGKLPSGAPADSLKVPLT